MDGANRGSKLGGKLFSCTPLVHPGTFELDRVPTVQIIICVLATPASLVTTVANLLVIISIWRTPSLHSPSNILLVGLAFTDFAIGSVTLPSSIIAHVAKITRDHTLFCNAYLTSCLSGYGLCGVSLVTVAAVSMDRYFAIHYHLRYQEIVTTKRTLSFLAIAWVVGSLKTVLLPFESIAFPYLNVSFGFVGLDIVLYVSLSIQRVVRRHQREIAAQMRVQPDRQVNLSQFKKSFVNMQILCWSLLICYLPSMILHCIVALSGYTTAKQSAIEFAMFLVHFNSALNPFIYCWRNPHIRAAVKKLILDLSWKP